MCFKLLFPHVNHAGSIDEAHALITRMMRSEVLQVEGRTVGAGRTLPRGKHGAAKASLLTASWMRSSTQLIQGSALNPRHAAGIKATTCMSLSLMHTSLILPPALVV